jgi:diguanylate cyclase (GGDEF)-like protein
MESTEKKRILLAAADRKAIARVSTRLWDEGFIVDSSSTAKGALVRLRELSAHVLVAVVGELDAEELCRQAQHAGKPITLLIYPEGTTDVAKRAEACGADGYLVGPLEPFSVANCVRWAVRLREATGLLGNLSRQTDERVLAPVPGMSEAAKLELELYKRFMLLEVRRSRRYGYPVAFLVIGIDRFASTVGRLPIYQRTHVAARILEQINDTIREIDLAAAEGLERFHVCLPQTPIEGARQVAERLRERLPKAGGGEIAFTVSVGISMLDGADPATTFRDLLADACAQLEHAQKAGGDRVESIPLVASVRRS